MRQVLWVTAVVALLAATAMPSLAQTYVPPAAQERPDPGERVDIYSRDGEHLGCYGGFASTCTQFSPDSIENKFGKGSEFNPDSLRNWDRDLDTSIKLELTEPDPFDWD